MKTWQVALIAAVSAAVLTGGVIAGTYEGVVVPRIQADAGSDVDDLQGQVDDLQGQLDDANDVIGSCVEARGVDATYATTLGDANDANRAAVDDFFTRFSGATGNATVLYAQLLMSDDDIDTAASTLLADGNSDNCVAP
ncbi:hypothetical protein BH10ACT6_BH10ACT6_12660 [soil metagenome]